MKNKKLLTLVLFAGFIFQQPATSQTTAATNGLTADMISNVVQASTSPEKAAPAGQTPASAEATSVPSGATAATEAGSNAPIAIGPANETTPVISGSNAVATPPPAEPAMASGSNAPTAMTAGNGMAETAPPNPATPSGLGTNAPVATETSSGALLAMAATNGMAEPGSTNMEPSTSANTQGGTNAQATAEAGTNAVAAAKSGTNAPSAPEMPITFQDVPIRTAIESLARLAGINYLLDPSIGYGQPGPNGQIKPEPMLTVRWEHVTAKQALLAVLDNYGLELVPNPKTGIARITVKPPNALPPIVTRVIQLKYASTSNMMAAINGMLTDKRDRVVGDQRTSQLVVSATDDEQADVDKLIVKLDKPTRQVLIETKLVELSSNPSTSKGIDWSQTLAAQNFEFGNGVLSQHSSTTINSATPGSTASVPLPGGGSLTTGGGTSTTVNKATTTTADSGAGLAGLALDTAKGFNPATAFLSADGVKAVLSFLNQSKEAQVVSTPRIVTLDNETATISVTRGYPVINVTASTAGVSSGSSQITYSNVGTVMQVTPRITANDYIWLKVVPDVSSFFGTDTKTIAGTTYQADVFDSRHIETQVLIPNAHTLVMGGLVQDSPNAQFTKVPILGDIPVLGLAFRSETKTMSKDNLLIFITPTIVQTNDFMAATTHFLQSSPRTMPDPMNPNSWWDSAEPRGDWSNPLKSADEQRKPTVLP